MSYSNQTTHYGLPLPTSSDRSVWTDNNTAFETIDSAIYTASQNATGASEAVSAMATTVTGHTASISTLNANVATLSTSVSGIESDLDTAESNISNLANTIESLGTAVSGKENALVIPGIYNGNIDDLHGEESNGLRFCISTSTGGTNAFTGSYYYLMTIGALQTAHLYTTSGNSQYSERIFLNNAWTPWRYTALTPQ